MNYSWSQASDAGGSERESDRAQYHVHGDVGKGRTQREEFVQEDSDVTCGYGEGGRGGGDPERQ